MKLTYTTYGVGHARIVIYRSDKEKTIFTAHFTDPVTGKEDTARFTAFSPMIHVGPPMLRRDFLLEAWEGDEKIGECNGAFIDGLQLTNKTGYFAKTPSAKPLVDHETISASKSNDGPGLRPTDIVLLSRTWEKIQHLKTHMEVDGQKLLWWDDNGLIEEKSADDRKISAWSAAKKSTLTELHVALVAILSGPQQGKAGYLLWGGDGGIMVSASEIKAAAIAPSIHHIPKWVHDKWIKLPPKSIADKR